MYMYIYIEIYVCVSIPCRMIFAPCILYCFVPEDLRAQTDFVAAAMGETDFLRGDESVEVDEAQPILQRYQKNAHSVGNQYDWPLIRCLIRQIKIDVPNMSLYIFSS